MCCVRACCVLRVLTFCHTSRTQASCAALWIRADDSLYVPCVLICCHICHTSPFWGLTLVDSSGIPCVLTYCHICHTYTGCDAQRSDAVCCMLLCGQLPRDASDAPCVLTFSHTCHTDTSCARSWCQCTCCPAYRAYTRCAACYSVDRYQVMPRALLVCYLLATHVTLTPAVLLCEQM